MYMQKILKGIGGIQDQEAQDILLQKGIFCNWWRNQLPPPDLADIETQLTEPNLDQHLNNYPAYGPRTPFISTTAGAIQQDHFRARNIVYPPLMTALEFATDGYQRVGYIFYGYVFTLGQKTVILREFAEEVRELHIYTQYLQYHHEGEIVAKIHIPSVRLEKVEKYDPQQMLADLHAQNIPQASWSQPNPNYQKPKQYANIRGVL